MPRLGGWRLRCLTCAGAKRSCWMVSRTLPGEKLAVLDNITDLSCLCCPAASINSQPFRITAAIKAVNQWLLGLRLLSGRSLQPNAVSLNAALAGVGWSWQKALGLGAAAMSSGLILDSAGYDVIMDACRTAGWQQAGSMAVI